MMPSQGQDSATRPVGRLGLLAALMCVAAAAAVLSLAVIAILVAADLRDLRTDPLDSPELAELRARLAANPRDMALAEKVRQLDLDLRRAHFAHVAFTRRGNYLLLGCVAVFLAAIRSALACAKKLKRPTGKAGDVDGETRATHRARYAVAALAGFLGAAVLMPVAVAAYIRWRTGPPPPPHYADPAEVARYWTRFRGPGGRAVSTHANVPTTWDANSGQSILWKVPVPLAGKSSPVVWKDRVFLTAASRNKRLVLCYEADSGKLLWQRPVENVPGSPVRPPEAWEDTGYAASTPTVDDRYVFAIFANGDLACFAHDGELIWAKGLGAPKNMYTHASSLLMFRHLLLVLWDQATVDDYMSKLLAFDGETGRLVWQKRRPVANSWATPVIFHDGKRHQLVCSANPWVISYDPAGAQELWRAKCMEGGDVASSPTYADGIAYAVSAETRLVAIRADGSGDVTKTHIIWDSADGLPDITSPLTDGKLLWTLTTGGRLLCYDAKTGKKAYEHEFEKVFNASPSLAGERLYLLTTKGVTYVVRAGRKFELLRTNKLGEAVYASPAFQDGRIYIRGKKHLYCIAKKLK